MRRVRRLHGHLFLAAFGLFIGREAANPMKRSCFFNQFGQSIIRLPREFGRLIGTGKDFHRRQRKRKKLEVIAEFIHDSESRIHIHDCRNVRNAFAHVFAGLARVDVFVVELLWIDVIKDVDLHSDASFLFMMDTAIAANVATKAGAAAAQNTRRRCPRRIVDNLRRSGRESIRCGRFPAPNQYLLRGWRSDNNQR